jgi:tripartite-type tricarboxylate transporter receptor subunit TctC
MGSQAVNAALYRNLPFDPVRDFTAVSLFVKSSNMLVAHPGFPARTLADLVAMARANPGRVNVGTAGAGSSQHFAAALFEHLAQVQFTHINYRGGAPAMTDLVAGRVDIVFSPIVEAVQQIRADQVRALAITRAQRSPEFPDVPAVAEAVPGYEFSSWLGAFAPAGTPPAAVQRMSQALAAGLRDPQLRERILALGYEPVGSTPEEFTAFFAAEMPRVAELVRISGAKVE